MDGRNPATVAIGVDIPTPLATILTTATSSLAAAATVAATTTASMTFVSSEHNPATPPVPEGECRLLGSFALLVQAALGGLALLVLVFKRYRERPQRPVKIWFFDASKQVFGSVLVHIANVFMSMLTSGRFTIKPPLTVATPALVIRDGFLPNPCSFYLLNLGIDTTLGIPILIVLLRIITYLVSFTSLGKPLESIQSGYYGSPPNAWWWLKQSVIYFCGLFCMKLCVLIIFLVMPWIVVVGDWALRWTEGNEKLQIAFVMMIFPLIMNALQYYIIDSYIKKDPENSIIANNDDGRGRFDQLRSSVDDDNVDTEEEHGIIRSRHGRPEVAAEYDPDFDGDAHTIIGSSASGRLSVNKDTPETSVKNA